MAISRDITTTPTTMGGCTVRVPATLLDEARYLGECVGLTRNAIIALALDEYLRRHGVLTVAPTSPTVSAPA